MHANDQIRISAQPSCKREPSTYATMATWTRCTSAPAPEEVAILEAVAAADLAAERAEEEALRDHWFAFLKESNGGSSADAGAQ